MSNSIKETLQAILDEASEKIEQSDALDKLNDVRVNFLGKKGQLTSVLKSMKDVAPEDRPKVGQMVNEARAKIETMMEETKTRLEKELREMGIQNMGACIGVPEVEDEYLTCDSVHFHEHLGFRMVGEFYKCGFKFGRWYNMAWMEKHIGEHGAQPKVTWKGEM